MKKRNPKQYRIIIALLLLGLLIYLPISFLEQKKITKEKEQWIAQRDQNPTTNKVIEMAFTDQGIEITGTIHSQNQTYLLELCNLETLTCEIKEANSTSNANEYQGNLSFEHLDNGTYGLYIKANTEEKVMDYRETIDKIVRAKIGDKLVTRIDQDHHVQFTIEDFKYQYDILIDPGHGGDDIGSYNDDIDEKRLNLLQSNYEKERYEEHGLTVKMIRDDYSYGIMMGEDSWSKVRQRAYAIGYYGVVAKVSYSNHHNSSIRKSDSGWEIIVPGRIAYDTLLPERKVKEIWEEAYLTREDHLRFYARDEEGELYSRENGETYDFTDYYAVIRIPYDLYHVKNILYEGCYLSNSLDYDWYYTKGNWKDLSEAKIKTYVEYLGKTYIPPKES